WHHLEPAVYHGHPDARLRMPKVVLTSHSTASAAEDFLIFVDAIPDVTTVGEPTYGSTGQPYHFALPGGGKARACTHRVTFPDGRDFVGTGITPKVPVTMTVDDWLGGRDVVLEKGREVLRAMIRARG